MIATKAGEDMFWRLGLDLGTNSIGWWAFRVTKKDGRWRIVESLDGGARIFSDGREPAKAGRVGDSLAVGRRMARGMRRNRDHGRNRIKALVDDLVKLKLLPDDEVARCELFQTPGKDDPFNPYRLRAEALERALSPSELGRALFHLGLRRGFKSNRKEASDEDGGKLKERIDTLRETLGNKTLGQYLWNKYLDDAKREQGGENRKGLRFRGDEDFYPDRAMYAEEFAAIRERQASEHKLSTEDWDRLRDRYVLFQWPLRPVERGGCEFFRNEKRHWRDTPIAHDFRIYQELNALRWIDDQQDHTLDAEQRDAVLDALTTRKTEVKFSSLRTLKRGDGSPMFPRSSRFNLESDKRKGLNPHRFAVQLMADKDLAALWQRREDGDGGALDAIFEKLHEIADEDELHAYLVDECGIEPEIAESLARLKLASGTGNVSRKFMERVVPVLRDQGLVYSDAVAELTDDDGNPLHHSLRDDGRRWASLPYYGEVLAQSMLGADPKSDPNHAPEKHFGKINNPTVHVALNQLRLLVNTLIKRFGCAPVEIHVELTRDLKLPRKKRDEITAKQGQNQRENERIKKICAEHGLDDPGAREIKKIKLWEELGDDRFARQCVFSGQTISAAQLFNGEAEIEHLLPFSRTLDDSMANLTVAMRWANRIKGSKTPHEAFNGDACADRGIIWEDVLKRAAGLPGRKSLRFGPNAMQAYERDGGFIARQLTDTAYMSQAAQRYLGALEGVEQVVPNRGRLTALVRGKWGLNGILSDDNRKNRDDHRHHAVDAAVIALTDRAVLNEVARLTARGADDIVHLAVPDLEADLRRAIRDRARGIVVAHKPDHGLQGRMFNETAYGFVAPQVRDPDLPEHNLVTRKELAVLSPKECVAIRDVGLREAVLAHLETAIASGQKHDKALVEFSKAHGVRRVRLLVKNQTVAPVPSALYKGYAPDSYVCCDIWRLPKGRPGNWRPGEYVWEGVFWPYAGTVSGAPSKAAKKPHPAAKFVMRLFKDDMVAFDDAGRTQVLRVAGFSTTNNKLDLRPQYASNAPQTYISINVLARQGLRKLAVSVDGRISPQNDEPES